MDSPTTLDLDAYFHRIGYTGSREVTLETLTALQRAHTAQVPFENLDVLLGHPPKLDLESLQAKLVRARRGGYCFEQNTLFASVLEQLGFPVTRFLGRVRIGTTRVLPRTHMVLKTEAEGMSWLVDVGFGGWGLIEPVIMVDGVEATQGGWRMSLVREGAWWVLRCPQCPTGPDLYTFSTEPQHAVDFLPANHYAATHPDSRFTQTLVVQRASPTIRRVLTNRELQTFYPDRLETTVMGSEADVIAVLAEHFDLHLPAGTSFAPTR